MSSARTAMVGLGVALSLWALSPAWAQDETVEVGTSTGSLPQNAPMPILEAREIAEEMATAPIRPELVFNTEPRTERVRLTVMPLDPLQTAVLAKLPELEILGAKLSREDREALSAFYASGRTFWVDASGWTQEGHSLIERLKRADEDGLEAVDYPEPLFAKEPASLTDRAEAEIKTSVNAILYAKDARGARVDPARISSLTTPKLFLPTASEVLTKVTAVQDAGGALASYNPAHPGYRALKERLAQWRTDRPSQPMVRIPQGRPLKLGMQDARVPLIRSRFNIGSSPEDQTVYDEKVATAVAAFQKEKGLPSNGVLTPQTMAALSGNGTSRLEGDLIANMERWRWLPPDLGERHVMVNVPEFRLRLMQNGQAIHQARVIVGRPETPTPVFSDEMETVIVNPSWTVPPSILRKEFLPGMASDPSYAQRRGFRVIRHGGRISVQQPPGARNALGYMKFIFPNDHAVYLHDTPNRSLFGADRRAFSHGCVRVDQPFSLAEQILKQEGSWSEPRLRSLIGKGERYIRLNQTLPVHLAYFTLSVDESGQLKSFDDLYGFHRKVRAALGFSG